MNAEEIQKLSDRDLLIKTYGKVEKMEGILTGGNSGGLIENVSELKKTQENFVTKNMLVLIIKGNVELKAGTRSGCQYNNTNQAILFGLGGGVLGWISGYNLNGPIGGLIGAGAGIGVGIVVAIIF